MWVGKRWWVDFFALATHLVLMYSPSQKYLDRAAYRVDQNISYFRICNIAGSSCCIGRCRGDLLLPR